MDRHPREILESALALPESERADLAASLIRSLDSDVDEDANTAWAAKKVCMSQAIECNRILECTRYMSLSDYLLKPLGSIFSSCNEISLF